MDSSTASSDDKKTDLRAERRARRRMIRRDLATRGVTDRRVLAAMAHVPREVFVPDALADRAYDDGPLPIGDGQTISQPLMVAVMTQALRLTRRSRVLEIGTGSGYHTAVLACIAAHVYSIERLETLQQAARERLRRVRVDNVTLRVGDGAVGWPDAGPFDGIVVAAAAPLTPVHLVEQLAPGGRLVVPIGSRAHQELHCYRRTERGIEDHSLTGCRFVPLVSPHAFGA